MSDKPYLIVGQEYFHGSAGVKAMHRLGHLLNETGQTAYLYKNRTNPKWNISTISIEKGDKLIKEGAIVVYPEVVFGNPLQARTVVRYLLNTPGLLGGDKTYAAAELLFAYSRKLLQPGMPPDRVICIPVVNTEIFYDSHEKRDLDYLVYVGKAKKPKGYPERKFIYRYKPQRQEDLGKLLRRCHKLISYDNWTQLNYEATLCGCLVVIMPDGSRRKDEVENNEYGLNGIAWGDSPEELERARKTLPQAPEVLRQIEEKLPTAIKNFIKVSQHYAQECSQQKYFPSVSIIIPTLNGRDQLQKNLPLLFNHLPTENPTEVIIVDDGSNDETEKFIKTNYPQVKLLRSEKSRGFAISCNRGARAAKNDYLLFLNNDLGVTFNFFPSLLKHFERQEVFGVSPKVIRPSRGSINESIILGGFEGGVINAKFSTTKNLTLSSVPLEVFSVCGAAFLVNRDKFFELDGFDEILSPFYYDETDLSYRALKHGWKIIYEPTAVVYHQHDQTIGRNFSRSRALWSYRKNQYLCVWKNITAPGLIFWHILQALIPRLPLPNLSEWHALFSALKRLPRILKELPAKQERRRSQYYRRRDLSDYEVLRIAAEQKKFVELQAKVKKILVIRPDAIGDLVLTLPAISALKKNFPQAKITALVREDTVLLLKNHPAIDEIISDYDFKKYNFDLSVNFYNQLKDTFATFKARIPYRLGDSARILTGWMNNLRVFRRWNDFTRHEVEFNLDLLEPLGIRAKETYPALTIDRATLDKMNNFLSKLGIKEDDLLVGVHIGGGGTHNKTWNNVGYAEVINWLQQEKGAKVILTGREDALEKSEKISLLCKIKPLNFIGKIKLEELVALTSKYKFYLGTDTGPIHIAAVLGIPLIVIFLSKRAKPLRWGPWGTRHLVVKNFSKCQKGCNPPECRENIICQNEIDPQEVISAAKKIISGGGAVNQEETLYHWCQKSFSILITSHPKNNTKAEIIKNLLTEAGYRTSRFNPPFSAKKLLNQIIKDDVSIIHSIDNFRSFQIGIAVLLSGSYLSNRALWVKTKDYEFKNAEGLIDFYITKFKTLKY